MKIDIGELELEIHKTNNQWLKITNCIILEYYHLKNLNDLFLLIKNFSEKGFTYDFHKEDIAIYKKTLI